MSRLLSTGDDIPLEESTVIQQQQHYQIEEDENEVPSSFLFDSTPTPSARPPPIPTPSSPSQPPVVTVEPSISEDAPFIHSTIVNSTTTNSILSRKQNQPFRLRTSPSSSSSSSSSSSHSDVSSSSSVRGRKLDEDDDDDNGLQHYQNETANMPFLPQPVTASSSRNGKTPSSQTRFSKQEPFTPSPNVGFKGKGLNEYEKAMWNFINVSNLDGFLKEVYEYYVGKGAWCILLSRGLNLLTVLFVTVFSTFLLQCVDYSLLPKSSSPDKSVSLSDVVIPKCYSTFSWTFTLLLIVFAIFYISQVMSFISTIHRTIEMSKFYTHVLGVPDADIQTISWPTIVSLISQIKEQTPLTSLNSTTAANNRNNAGMKLDAHDIANRILRQENYLIALFNKDLIDLSVPVPAYLVEHFPKYFAPKMKSTTSVSTGNGDDGSGDIGREMTLTRALEWNLRFCLMGYLFDADGNVRKAFLREKNKASLIVGLKRRLYFMALINAISAPVIVVYLLLYSFFRYFEEYHSTPSALGSRTYTLYAKWKFREFNELPHLFTLRLDSSYPIAKEYIDLFPKGPPVIAARFVAFIAGSFASVLLLLSVWDPELVLHFEITGGKTVLFWIGIFGGVLAVARGMIPPSNTIFEPELLLRGVIHYTHYFPSSWENQLHSQHVHSEFGKLFEMKLVVFVQEMMSVVLTPLILAWSVPKSAGGIVDFFREFTVKVEGVGYVCSFAVFDFKRHGNVKFGAPAAAGQTEHLMSKEGKMEKSFLNFKASHPDWMPNDTSASLYLSKVTAPDLTSYHNHPTASSIYQPHLRGGLNSSRYMTTPGMAHSISTLSPRYQTDLSNSVDASRLIPTRSAVAKGKRRSHSPAVRRTTAQQQQQQQRIPEVEEDDGWAIPDNGGEISPPIRDVDGDKPGQEELPDDDVLGLLQEIYGARIVR